MFVVRERGWTLLSLMLSLTIGAGILVLSLRAYYGWQRRLNEQALVSDVEHLWSVAGDYFKMTGCDAKTGLFASQEGQKSWEEVAMRAHDNSTVGIKGRLPWVRDYALSVSSELETGEQGDTLRHYYLTLIAGSDLSESALCGLGVRLGARSCSGQQLRWRRSALELLPDMMLARTHFQSVSTKPSFYYCH